PASLRSLNIIGLAQRSLPAFPLSVAAVRRTLMMIAPSKSGESVMASLLWSFSKNRPAGGCRSVPDPNHARCAFLVVVPAKADTHGADGTKPDSEPVVLP